LHRLVMR